MFWLHIYPRVEDDGLCLIPWHAMDASDIIMRGKLLLEREQIFDIAFGGIPTRLSVGDGAGHVAHFKLFAEGFGVVVAGICEGSIAPSLAASLVVDDVGDVRILLGEDGQVHKYNSNGYKASNQKINF